MLADISEQFAACSACGHGIPMRRRPLFVVTGADGAGKSAMLPRLGAMVETAVVLDKDLLFGPWSDDKEFSRWLRLAFGIGISGFDLVLTGMIYPSDLLNREWRFLVDPIEWCLLDCDDDERLRRLRSRPKSASIDDAKIAGVLSAAEELRHRDMWTEGLPFRIDTTHLSPDEAARAVADWHEAAKSGERT